MGVFNLAEPRCDKCLGLAAQTITSFLLHGFSGELRFRGAWRLERWATNKLPVQCGESPLISTIMHVGSRDRLWQAAGHVLGEPSMLVDIR
jgi:hypothetical protein